MIDEPTAEEGMVPVSADALAEEVPDTLPPEPPFDDPNDEFTVDNGEDDAG